MVLLGPITEKTTIEIDHGSEYFGFRFQPGQAPRLINIKEADLVNRSVDIETIAGYNIGVLAKRLIALQEHTARKRVMEDLIRLILPSPMDERCLSAAAMINSFGGRVKIAALADQMGIHVRSVERLFQSELGLSPKTMVRHVRLRKVMGSLHTGNYTSLAELAYVCGYADQSHMIREFKELTGKLPSDSDACEPHPVDGEPATRIVHRFRP